MPLQFTPEQIDQLFKEALPATVQELKAQLLKSAQYPADAVIREAIQKEVQEWCNKEVIPALRDKLAESKEGIINAAIVAVPIIAERLGVAMIQHLDEQLKESYKRGKVFKALFGDGY